MSLIKNCDHLEFATFKNFHRRMASNESVRVEMIFQFSNNTLSSLNKLGSKCKRPDDEIAGDEMQTIKCKE